MQEGGGFGFGRSRARYQHANSNSGCSWGDYSFPIDTWQLEPPLPVEQYAPENICVAMGLQDNNQPNRFYLGNNYPNPFNPSTKIYYRIVKNEYVTINIYDLMGRNIKSLVNSNIDAGLNQVVWDATNNFGQPVAAGVYIYRIEAGEFRSSKKMILLK